MIPARQTMEAFRELPRDEKAIFIASSADLFGWREMGAFLVVIGFLESNLNPKAGAWGAGNGARGLFGIRPNGGLPPGFPDWPDTLHNPGVAVAFACDLAWRLRKYHPNPDNITFGDLRRGWRYPTAIDEPDHPDASDVSRRFQRGIEQVSAFWPFNVWPYDMNTLANLADVRVFQSYNSKRPWPGAVDSLISVGYPPPEENNRSIWDPSVGERIPSGTVVPQPVEIEPRLRVGLGALVPVAVIAWALGRRLRRR